MAKLLIVEDDNFLANAYRVKLTKAGFDIRIAFDGEQALKMLSDFTPDCIILDLVIPKKDGFTVLSEIRGSPNWNNIPVLVASNLGMEEDINKAMKMGASGYVIKSDLSMAEMVEKIRSLLPKPTI